MNHVSTLSLTFSMSETFILQFSDTFRFGDTKKNIYIFNWCNIAAVSFGVTDTNINHALVKFN